MKSAINLSTNPQSNQRLVHGPQKSPTATTKMERGLYAQVASGEPQFASFPVSLIEFEAETCNVSWTWMTNFATSF